MGGLRSGRVDLTPHPERERIHSTVQKLGRCALVSFGHGDNSGETIAYFPGFLGDPFCLPALDEAAELALARRRGDGELPRVVIAPGHGTRSMREASKDTLQRAAEGFANDPELKSVLLGDSDQVFAVGHSFGGRVLPYLLSGAKWRDKVRDVVLNDPPGVGQPLGLWRLAVAQIREGRHLKRYLKASPDTAARQHWGQPVRLIADGTEPVSKREALQHIVDLARGGFDGSYRGMLEALPAEAKVLTVSPQLSHMNNPEAFHRFIRQQAGAHPDRNLKHMEVQEGTHNMHIGHPGYLGFIAARAYEL